ncbi:hypothetical protein BHE74_00017618 [Ensete ventricosum]|nr:hypothetical protein BHE74_00017618 [Ensete ventricosum]
MPESVNGHSGDMGPPSSAKNDRGVSGACLLDEFRLRVLVSKHLLVQALIWSSAWEVSCWSGGVRVKRECSNTGRCRSFYNGCCRSFVPDNLTAFMVYHAAVPSTMLIVLAMRRAFVGGGCRPYLCQVGGMTTGTPVHPVGYLRRVGHVDRPTVRGCDDSTAMSTFVI